MDLLVLNSEPSFLFYLLLPHNIIYSTDALPVRLNVCDGDVEMWIPLFAPLMVTILKTLWIALNLQLN